jgi:hypothetical protein
LDHRPGAVIPGNEMTFAGVKDPQQRLDLLAFAHHAARLRCLRDSRSGLSGSAEMATLSKSADMRENARKLKQFLTETAG